MPGLPVTLIASANGADVHCCDWRDLLPVVDAAGGCDLLIADTPYSDKTHSGHDEGVWAGDGARRIGAPFRRRDGKLERPSFGARRTIDYSHWTADDVAAFVEAWHPHCRGWFVSLTDHVLAPAWSGALEAAGRYVFAPIGYTATGSRVRLSGDGPACWMVWIIVARPRSPEFARWGALPGAYVLPAGFGEDKPIPGGKETWISQRLVEHYSRPGGLVVDATCGAGTTAVGAIRSGRRAIVGDANREHAEIAAQWIKHPHRVAPGNRERPALGQVPLFGGSR